MPRYSLRTLTIVMLLGGPVLAMAWSLLNRGFVCLLLVVYFALGIAWLALLNYQNEQKAEAARKASLKAELKRKRTTSPQ